MNAIEKTIVELGTHEPDNWLYASTILHRENSPVYGRLQQARKIGNNRGGTVVVVNPDDNVTWFIRNGANWAQLRDELLRDGYKIVKYPRYLRVDKTWLDGEIRQAQIEAGMAVKK